MKVAVICRVLWSAGTPEIAINEFRGLRSTNRESELIFFGMGPGSDLIAPFLDDIPIRVLSTRSGILAPVWCMLMNWAHGTSRHPRYKPEGSLDFSGLLRGLLYLLKSRPDIVLAHDQYSGLVAFAYARFTGSMYVVYMHESLLEDPGRRLEHLSKRGASRVKRLSSIISHLVLSKASAILCNSEGTLRSVKKVLQNDSVPMEVLVPGFPVIENPGTHDRPWILSVSTWDAGRHPELYQQVARLVQDSVVVLAGSWRYDNTLEMAAFLRSASEEISAGKLIVTGPISQSKLDSFYRESRVFLRFGVEEQGPGMGAIRAISHGLPVVTNAPLGVSYVVDKYRCGAVLPFADPSGAAAIIGRMLGASDEWERLHLAAEKAASENTWEKHNRELDRVLRSVRSQ
jgi:glycosyltransferase involved in cell wall biosynthesis